MFKIINNHKFKTYFSFVALLVVLTSMLISTISTTTKNTEMIKSYIHLSEVLRKTQEINSKQEKFIDGLLEQLGEMRK